MAKEDNKAEQPELQHVVGAILRDIARSRVTADVFSRNVSKYYEKDSLLRTFPIPRAEISEVNIDLRFAIIDAVMEDHPIFAGAGKIIEDASSDIVNEVFEKLRDAEDAEAWRESLGKLEMQIRPVLLTDLIELLEDPEFVLSSAGEDVGEKPENVSQLIETVDTLLETSVYQRINTETTAEHKKSFRGIFVSSGEMRKRGLRWDISDSLRTRLAQMALDLKVRGQSYRLLVGVTSHELQSIPEAAISSVRITTVMRNYVWSQVEEREGEAVRRLIPE